MKYVIDASTAFQWEVPEPDSLKAIRLREDYRNGIHELISPDIFPAEVGNALLVAERKGRIVAGQFAILALDTQTPDALRRLNLCRVENPASGCWPKRQAGFPAHGRSGRQSRG